MILDPNSRVVAYNQAFLSLVGFEETEVDQTLIGLTRLLGEDRTLLEKSAPRLRVV